MANIEKKKAKLESRIKELEDELMNVLHKKDSSQAEINLPARVRQIAEAKAKLAKL